MISLSQIHAFNIWKYVDDSTVSETISKGKQSNMQLAANQVQDWSKENLFQLNCDKTKELVINYSRSNQEEFFLSVYIEGKPISIVTNDQL